MAVNVVSSMSRVGYDQYGRNFLSSYYEHCELPITVYSEDPFDRSDFTPLAGVEKAELLADYPRHRHWTLDAGRFAKKAFAIIDALDNANGHTIVWLDADTVLDAPLTEERVSRLVGDHYCGLMMREHYHPCSSFVIYRTQHPDNERFVSEMKRMYHDMALMEEEQRHDAYIQGRILENGFDVTNLTPGAQPMENVFDWLGFGHHLKGNLKWKTTTSSHQGAVAAVSSLKF